VFKSLRSRVIGLAALVCVGSIALFGLLLFGAQDSRTSFRWVRHTQDVIIQLDATDSNLKAAEAGIRGYFMSGSISYLDGFETSLAQAKASAAAVHVLVSDNALQEGRATKLAELVNRRAASLGSLGNRARISHAPLPQDPAKAFQARKLTERISTLVHEMREVERKLLDEREARADRISGLEDLVVFLSGPLFVVMVGGAAWAIIAGIHRPLSILLEAVGRFGDGDREVRVRLGQSGTEFRRLGAAYNTMANSLVRALERQEQSEEALARVNNELVEQGDLLMQRSSSIELISGMSQRLQALREPGELTQVLECFLPQVLPGLAGQLYLFNNSRNLLVRAVSWGAPSAGPETFAPDDCWGLRRGYPHQVTCEPSEIVCKHADHDCTSDQLCRPVMAGGQILGLFYIQGAIGAEDRFRLGLVAENVALALVNENLRKRLREQSIRDPLTGLFNRRYLEETLTLESSRSSRNDTALSVIMADVDHFKRFNDTYGHPAGDALLKEVARMMQDHFREGDIVCRYGGEEFAIIAPGADLDLISRRTESLRQAMHQLSLTFEGRDLGQITMSFGMACSPGKGGPTGQELIGRADQALYRAKHSGRDRAVLADFSQTLRKSAA